MNKSDFFIFFGLKQDLLKHLSEKLIITQQIKKNIL
jgi:hypothetical protein